MSPVDLGNRPTDALGPFADEGREFMKRSIAVASVVAAI